MLDEREQIEVEDIDWRAGLEHRVSMISVILLSIASATIFVQSRTESMRQLSIVLIALTIGLVVLLSIDRIPRMIKSVGVLVSLAIASIGGYIVAGFLSGPALATALLLVVSGLLFGRKTFTCLIIAFIAISVIRAISVAQGFWPSPNPTILNPGDLNNWIRTSLITVALWTSIGVSVLFAVNAVEENLARRRAALSRLQKEINERRKAEKARREAQAVASHAQKMEAVGQLASGIAHDFNNALLVIQGWNEIWGQCDVENKQGVATAAIAKATEHTAQLSRQLLTFARKDVRIPIYLPIDQLVKESLSALKHIVGSDVHVQVDTQTDKIVHVDESQFQQLIFNLVINARDALDDTGNIKISVRNVAASDQLKFDANGEKWIVLQVEDDGHGMDAEAQKRVFDPFYSTKEPGKGTGLGLSTVLGIVQQSGGYIDLQSQPGCTRFSIFLPATDTGLEEEVEATGPVDASKFDLRILLVEDDPHARKMMVSVLKNSGNEVFECVNGDVALSILNDHPEAFDLLCSDAVFPGAELGDVLEAFERHSPDAMVLICSGYVPGELAIRKLESGQYAYIAKPFTGSQLIAKIQEMSDTVSSKD